MTYDVDSVKDYINALPEDRQVVIKKLQTIINKNLPKGFQEGFIYKMLGWVVPHSLYPDGYHCKPTDPLPFLNVASQKNSISLYHMGLYADPKLMSWFTEEYPKHCKRKLDMGKSCVRFKKMDDIPYDLIGQLMKKMTPKDWIKIYEKNIKK